MTHVNCKSCGTLIPAGAAFCPECGLQLASENTETDVRPILKNPDLSHHPNTISFNAMEHSKFFKFFGTFINAMEHGEFFRKPLRWLYMVFALLNILVPVYLLFMIISRDVINMVGIGALAIWLVFAFAGWMGFQLWWNRQGKIDRCFQKGDDFFAIPLFSHYIQTTGEWLGVTITILGAGSSLVILIFFSGNNAGGLNMGIPLPFQGFGAAGIVISPILGFTIVLITKVAAEFYRALASIANNTRQMALHK